MSNFKVSLNLLFKELESRPNFCIVKLPKEFPDYIIGSDLDFFCYDIEETARTILAFLQKFISEDLTIKIIHYSNQIHIDFKNQDKIIIRFDLYGRLPAYKNVLIKESLFSSIIENSIMTERGDCKVRVPSQLDENIIRYIEYHEYYAQRPDKIKHIDYIQQSIKNSNINLNNFFDKLYYYTEIPLTTKENINLSKPSYFIYLYKKFSSVMKQRGFKNTIVLIYKKLRTSK